MGKCSVCEKEFENKYFDVKQNKCILHCDKHEENNWFKINKNHNSEWDRDKVILFWQKINNDIEVITDVKTQNKEVFEEMIKEYNYEYFKYKFEKVIFPFSIFDSLDDISFRGLNSDIDIQFIECKFLSSVDFSLLNKAKNINFSNCEFFSSVNFENIKFDNQFFLENCVVHNNMNFINVIFTNITSFMNSEFYAELNFMHSRFDNLALFNDLKNGKLLLGNTFFRGESNFLSMNVRVHDRETARIIKNSFEQQNNIIEANRFYALEMEKREEELDKEIKKSKNITEWLIFKIHDISSKHSQDWVLSLYWIIVITFLYSHLKVFWCQENTEYYIIPFVLNILILTFVLLEIAISKNLNIIYKAFSGLIIYFIYAFITKDVTLECFSNNINPFSIMTGHDILNFSTLIYKIIIAYLLYQFIVSIRQNTRRK
jgi:hypothetical protein